MTHPLVTFFIVVLIFVLGIAQGWIARARYDKNRRRGMVRIGRRARGDL
jgi:hypothetical protein